MIEDIQSTLRELRAKLWSFNRDDRASVTVESVLILPILITGLVLFFVFFDMFHKRSIAYKAHYVVADYISRQPSIDEKTINGLRSLYRELTGADDESFLRIYVTECSSNCSEPDSRVQDWYFGYVSDNTGGATVANKSTRDTEVNDRLPIMYKGQWMAFVETKMVYRSPLNYADSYIGTHEFLDQSAFSQRFIKKLEWDGASSAFFN